MLFLFYLFYNLAFNALLFSYPTEVMPYPIRARGMSVLLLCGRSAQVINTLLTPIGLKAIGWKYYLVYVGFLVFEVVGIYLFIVETKGPSLEAIAERFDGKNPVIQTVEAGEDKGEGNARHRGQGGFHLKPLYLLLLSSFANANEKQPEEIFKTLACYGVRKEDVLIRGSMSRLQLRACVRIQRPFQHTSTTALDKATQPKILLSSRTGYAVYRKKLLGLSSEAITMLNTIRSVNVSIQLDMGHAINLHKNTTAIFEVVMK